MPFVTLVAPYLDIVLISIGFNIFAYAMYAYLYKREFVKIASVDLRLSIAELLLVIAIYAPGGVIVSVPYIGDMAWWMWYIIISIPIEIIFFFAYKNYFNLSWDDIVGVGHKD